MRDVLEVLAKLPMSCMVWENGQAYIIHRGVMGRHEYPIPSENAVTIWNQHQKITPEQVAAMQAGSIFGWDSEAADLVTPGGDTTYIYSAPMQVLLSVNSSNENDAARMAEQAVQEFVEYLRDTSHNHVVTVARDGDLDLVDEQTN